MKYALNLAADGRILSATYERYASVDAALVDALPTGETEAEQNIANWLYVGGAYVYDPLPEPEPVLPEPDPAEPLTDADMAAAILEGVNEV